MTLRAGVDLGGTKVQTVIVDEQFSVLGQHRLPTPTAGGPQDVADTIAATIREACHRGRDRAGRARVDRRRLAG